MEQRPVLHAVAAGENEFGLGHGNPRRVHGHRAEVLDAWQVARHLLGHVQFANLMAGLADRLGAFRRGQQQARQGALDVLAAGAGAADAAAVLDLPTRPAGRSPSAAARRRPSSPPPLRLSGNSQWRGASWFSRLRRASIRCSGA